MGDYLVVGEEYDATRFSLDVVCRHLKEAGDSYFYSGGFSIVSEDPLIRHYTSNFTDCLLGVKEAGLLEDPHPMLVHVVAEAALTWWPSSLGGIFFHDKRENFLMLVSAIDEKFGAAVQQQAVQSHDAAKEARMTAYQSNIVEGPKPARAHRPLSAAEEAESAIAGAEMRQRLIKAGMLKTVEQLKA